MDEYKFVNPSAPPACIKAFSLPPPYPDQIQFQPPTLPQNWGDKGAEGKQKTRSPNDRLDHNNIDYNYVTSDPLHDFQKCRYVSSLPRVCFPLYPFSTILRGTTLTDIFVKIVKPGFGGSHVGAFRIRRSPPLAIKDHRLPPALTTCILKTLLLPTAPGRTGRI